MEKVDNTPKNTPRLAPPWKPGQSGNPNGRPKGALNWDTIFKKAIKKIALREKIPVKDVQVDLVITAVTKALRGNYAFWKDIMDRNFGSTSGDTNIGIDNRKIEISIISKCKYCGKELE